jgi:2-polyprenyl-6-methoxyphenol hydroxylase-like FAD-dependent oxidoreductase
MPERVLIVGAGLAGLSAGIALASRGYHVDLVDLDARVDGASIGISARAVDALAELGVLAECEAEATVLPVPVFSNQWDSSGNQLPLPPMPQIPPRPDGIPAMIVIYRPILARILEAAAMRAGVNLRRPLSISQLRNSADSVAVTFTDGGRSDYALVIGADGLHSATRKLVFGTEIEPHYIGHMSLRWVARDIDPGQSGFYHSDAGGMLAVALLPGRMTYTASGVDLPNRPVSPAEARDFMREVLDGFSYPYIAELRSRLDDQQVVIARPYETVRIDGDWYREQVLLIGDAAHATTPNVSSGGGMALEDGVVLAQELAAADNIPAALECFMRRRRTRVNLVVDSSIRLMELDSSGASQQEAAPIRMMAMGTLAQPY